MSVRRISIPVWLAVIVIPIALPFALLAGLLSKPAKRSASDVASYLRGFIDGTDDDWSLWDEFECVPIQDSQLEQIRLEAVKAGPPNVDFDKLRECLARAEALST